MEEYCDNKLVFVGVFCESIALKDINIFTGYLAVINGKIHKKGLSEEFAQLKDNGFFSGFTITYLNDHQFIIPGFIDCHTHAPQFPNIGNGLDKPLLEWLKHYTFPLEKKNEDLNFASKVYDQVIKRLLTNGTTTACYFGSLHLNSTIELAKCAARHGQRALVGKVSMNVENEEGYYNKTNIELKEVEQFITTINDMENDLILPVVTPRFAISCDSELMTGLSKFSKKYNCRIQSHISENKDEISFVLKINPQCSSYAEIYDVCGLLTNKTIMAHGVHLTPSELTLLRERDVGLAHCPASNTRLASGLCPVRNFLDADIKTGLGTDVSGGDNASILDAIRRAMDVSTHLDFINGSQEKPVSFTINWVEAFYLATLGGARVLNLQDKIGNFDIGKDFDALLVDVHVSGCQIDKYEWKSSGQLDLIQKFIYLGDDRNILQVFVKGRKVKDIMVDYNHRK